MRLLKIKIFLIGSKLIQNIFSLKIQKLIFAIKKSCLIKLFFVNKDINEKNLRMILNFGHTFAHAIEVKITFQKIQLMVRQFYQE